jgi:TonB family protein
MMLAGCGVTQQIPFEQPELISMSALPPAPAHSYVNQLKLNVLFRVLKDGTVTDVRILGTSGESKWDAAAIDSMKQWRFATAFDDTSTAGRWIRYTLVVGIQEPMVMNLGELVLSTQAEADSLYHLLETGIAFDTLARHVRKGSADEAGRYLGMIDIARYPGHVRDELRTLAESNFTHPIRVGHNYVIYKRFTPDGSRNLAQ